MVKQKIPTIVDLFDISDYEHKELFDGIEYPWDVLRSDYKKEYISSVIKPNIKKIKRDGALVRKDTVIYDDDIIDADFTVERGSATKGKLNIFKGKEKLTDASLICAGSYLEGNSIQIGKGVIVEEGAFLGGFNLIGDNNEIRNGAYVRGEVITGKGCVLGHVSEIKSSIFLNNSKAPHFAYVGDSVLGNNVNLGAGTKISNLKIYGNEISIIHEGGKINTGLRKFGAIIGDNVETGCNSVLNPGVILGRNCLVYPCCALKKDIYPKKSLIKTDGKIQILK